MVVAVAKAQRCESNCWTGVHRLGRVRLSGGDGGGDRAGVCVFLKSVRKRHGCQGLLFCHGPVLFRVVGIASQQRDTAC